MSRKTNPTAQPVGVREFTEGSAKMTGIGGDVFYNPVQVPNRDLSILILNVFGEQWEREAKSQAQAPVTWKVWGGQGLDQNKPLPPAKEYKILEALSATGLRSIRYAKEISHPKQVDKVVICNDMEFAAVESIKRHTASNAPYPAGMRIEPSHADAIELMMRKTTTGQDSFQAIDLDPYGAPSPFLDSAMQCIENGGLMCVTATDTAVLCGAGQEKCFQKYGYQANHKPYQQEMGIRIVLASMHDHANRHGKYIVPLVSLRLDFYVRVFVRVYDGKPGSGCLSHVLQSRVTDSFKLLPVDSHNALVPGQLFEDNVQAGELGGFHLAGPIWSKPMFNFAFVDACLAKLKLGGNREQMKLGYAERIQGILTAARLELLDAPLYYSVNSLCNLLHCVNPPLEKFQAALMNQGYETSQSHQEPNVIKTNAPNHVIWDILRCWIQKHPISRKRLESQPDFTTMNQLLKCEPKFQANFDSPQALRERINSRKSGGADAPKWFVQNPEKNWGPKSRAHGGKTKKADDDGEEEPSKKQKQ